MPLPAPFTFRGASFRAFETDGIVWFVASDLAKTLGYRDAEKLTRILDDDHKGTRIVGTPGGDQEMTVVSEPGMYRAVMRSQRPEAKEFERWVIGEVLPAIRKTGGYRNAAALLEDPAALRMLLMERNEEVIALRPKAKAWDLLASTDGTLCVSDAAKALGMRPKDLFAWLSAEKWIYRRGGSAHWVGYQDKTQRGLLDHVVAEVTRPDGSSKITERVRITAKGMQRLSEAFSEKEAA